MPESVKNERYEAIVDAALGFFTILVSLKLADLIDDRHATLSDDKWPCFVIGVAVFLRYVTGSAVHQKAQHVNQRGEHDGQFLVDIAFLIAFGVIAVWACVADTVPVFLCRLIWFTSAAFAWSVVYLACALVALAGGKPIELRYLWWLAVNGVQFAVFWWAEHMWSPVSPIISIFGHEFRWLWLISVAAVLVLFWDLALQLRFHKRPTSSP